jgi:hypothetical protein
MSTLIGKSDTQISLAISKSEYTNTLLELDFKLVESDPNSHQHQHVEEDNPHKHNLADLETELSEMQALVHQHEATIADLKQTQNDLLLKMDTKTH